jgi:acetyl esterase/lipase
MKSFFLPALAGILICPLVTLAASPEVEDIPNVEVGAIDGYMVHTDIALPKIRPAKPMPAVMWIHGGGWNAGSYKDNQARVLAERGYFTMSVDYRLSDIAVWPAQIIDCKMAIRWLRANAAKYDVNPNRIGVWGQSAGGHLACCVGMMDESAGFDKTGGNLGVSSRVQAVMDYSGPTDLAAKNAVYEKSLVHLFGAANMGNEELLRGASPLTWVRPGLPPFMIVHGDCDPLVPYSDSVRLKAALDRVKVSADLLTIHGGGHIYEAMSDGPVPTPDPKAFRKAVFAFFDRTLK